MRRQSICLHASALLLTILHFSLRVDGQPNRFAGHVASTPPLRPAEEKKKFQLPPGFDAELVAADPQIHKPMNLAIDDHGRIWVTDTIEYPYPVQGGRKPRDTVKILEDFGPDGRARKITTFADGLNIPIGVLPLSKRQAIVFSIPHVLKLTDTDGDGKADKREVLLETFGARDTHGMTNAFTWGFDGWIYACHGFSNTSTVKSKDGSKITMQSGNVYRFKPDGSRVEYYTHGQVNPFGLCFDPRGNLYSSDCHTKPIYQLLRGAWYPSFGKPHDGLGFGPGMMTHTHDSTAIAGIVCYDADHFPKQYRDTIFIGNVVTNRINHDRLEWHGSTPKAIRQPDLLKSDDPWFRPVDLQMGPDGALYVADFYNCIIGHYEVPLDHPKRDRHRGRIWRIVYRGTDGKGKPRSPRQDWTKASLGDLIGDLDHPNLDVRTKATNQLALRGDAGAKSARALFSKESSARQRAHGLWVLHRTGSLKGNVIEKLFKDDSRLVTLHLLRALGEIDKISENNRAQVIRALGDKDANVQRAAAECLGRHPSIKNLQPLLDLRHRVPKEDTHLSHVTRMALRDQLLPAGVLDARKSWKPKDAKALADVALGVPHSLAAGFLVRHLAAGEETGFTLHRMIRHVARHGDKASRAEIIKLAAMHRPDKVLHQARLIQVIQSGLQEGGATLTPDARRWAEQLARRLIASKKQEQAKAGLELIGSVRLAGLKKDVIAYASSRSAPLNQRTAALDSLVSIDTSSSIPLLSRALNDGSEAAPLREHCANLLARVNQDSSRKALVQALPFATASLQRVVALALVNSKEGGELLLEAIGAGKASPRLLQNRLLAVRLERLPIPDVKARLAKLTQGIPTLDQALLTLIRQRSASYQTSKTDLMIGKLSFEKRCASCHQIADKGTKIGPQLDGIGARGVERILEDLLDPSRNVDQQFRTTTLELKKGQVVSGLLLKAQGEVLVLADAKGKEVRVPKASVEKQRVLPVSPMPDNFAQEIPEKELYHLLRFLLNQKAKN